MENTSLRGGALTATKARLKVAAQKLLGYDNYLLLFAICAIIDFRYGAREPLLLKFISMLPNEGVVLDVGANIGITTTLIKWARPKLQVVAFEPAPFNIRAWQRVVRLFRLEDAVMQPYAVGDTAGTLEMVLPLVNGVLMHGLVHARHDSIANFNKGTTFSATVIRLDEVTHLWNRQRIAGMKIDVENFEQFAFRGAHELLRRDRPIVYSELWDNDNRVQSFRILRELGYCPKVLDGDVLTDFQPTVHQTCNFLFLP